ncbi:MAG: ATP-dependent RNA helicase DeaD, partial [Porticoccaceae bacterium]
QYVTVKSHQKMDALTRFLEVETFDGMIIFVRTKSSTVDIAERLEARGFRSSPLNGDLSQVLRERTINRLKKGQVDIVVATDVAARGLDVERISHVINFDIPYDNESYVHRIGRTGRAGRDGKAILFITPKEIRLLRSIEKSTRQSITPLTMPSNDEVSSLRIQQFTTQLIKTMENPKLDKFRSLIEKLVADNELDITDVATALAFENQKERPLFPRLETIATPDMSRTERGERGPRDRDSGRDTRGRPDRNDRGSRSEGSRERPDRPKRESAGRPDSGPEVGMVTYRLEVGNNDGISPSNIVGAIANEADISSQYIGSIKLFDDYSTVDLPEGMPSELLTHLQKVRVCAKPMRISVYNGDAGGGAYAKQQASSSDRKSSADRKPSKDFGNKKTLTRNVDNKRTADSQQPPKKSFGNKKAGGSYAKDSPARKPIADGKSFSERKEAAQKPPYSGKPPNDGSSPVTKKKTYTKKPKKS